MFKRKKSTFQKYLYSSTNLTLIGFLVVALVLVPLVKNVKKQLSVNKEFSSLQKEIVDLEKKNTELKGLISYLNSEEFTEEQARLNLNYKKEGEEVLVIKEQNSNNNNSRGSINNELNSIYNIKGLRNTKVKKPENLNSKKWISYFLN